MGHLLKSKLKSLGMSSNTIMPFKLCEHLYILYVHDFLNFFLVLIQIFHILRLLQLNEFLIGNGIVGFFCFK